MLTRRSPRRTYRQTGPSGDVVEVVLERANFSCEICNGQIGDRRGFDWSYHHRRPRGLGGTRWPGINLPGNGLILCGSGTTGCHGDVESNRALSVRAGYLVLSRTDPTQVAVILHKERFVYLDNVGRYLDEPPERES